ncbi:MAG: isochorismate synthase [Rhodocyclaceae bacterium]|nr:isochorismate synthase [Rhodocyclaceae bacterium]
MTATAATRPAACRGLWEEFGPRLELAVQAAAGPLAAIEPGRLASLSIVLPGMSAAARASVGGDSCWLAPHQEFSLYGSGTALRFDDDVIDGFQAACARWCALDAHGIPPVAWFSMAAATAAPRLSLRVPRLLLRLAADGATLTLSTRREAAVPPSEVARQWLAELRQFLAPAAEAQRADNAILALQPTPNAETWCSRVRTATSAIAAGQFAKVVLARRLAIRLAAPVVPGELAARLARIHPECYALSFPHGRGWVVAASPELLAAKRGRRLVSHALAGTARRHAQPDEDAQAAAALLASPKERHEHGIVVDAIAARMVAICDGVDHPATPAIMPLRFLQHLCTPVSGCLRPGAGLLDAVCRLHPTPAVLGHPVEAARAWLARAEESRDGLYSGVAGWIDAAGDGDGVVVLRSAYLEDRSAILWAGAGIVAQSDAAAELAETELKLAAMLEVLRTS